MKTNLCFTLPGVGKVTGDFTWIHHEMKGEAAVPLHASYSIGKGSMIEVQSPSAKWTTDDGLKITGVNTEADAIAVAGALMVSYCEGFFDSATASDPTDV